MVPLSPRTFQYQEASSNVVLSDHKNKKHILPSRGGILEPEGIVEIKFRKKDLVKVMRRVDPIIKDLQEQINRINQNQPPLERKSSISQHVERKKPPEIEDLEKRIAERENHLLPMYHQVSVHFADLHDTPERMHEKGTVSVSN